jgi:cobalt-zinc-cadmium resistance protein CzcA
VAPDRASNCWAFRTRSCCARAKYAIADITLDFADGTDIYWARQQVSERLGGVMGDLPGGTRRRPGPDHHAAGRDVHVHDRGRSQPGRAANGARLGDPPRACAASRAWPTSTPWAAWCETLRGRARPGGAGGAWDLAAAACTRLWRRNNRNDGAGRLISGEEALLVRSDGSIQQPGRRARYLAITQDKGMATRVGDVAEVRLGALTRYGSVTQDGQGEAVQGLVLGLRGANAAELVRDVRARLAEIEPACRRASEDQPFYDRGALVDRAVGTVAKALGEAIALVLVLLLLFLGNLRAALVVAADPALSILATFVLMQQWELSANLMSLGGLAIAIGMLVDAAVVVVEQHRGPAEPTPTRKARLHQLYRRQRAKWPCRSLPASPSS